MKNNLLKYYIVAVYLCSTFILFAQPGTGDDSTGGLEGDGDVTPGAPIDDFIPILAILGIIVVFMRFRAIKAKETRRQNRTL